MTEVESPQVETEEMTDEQAILKIAQAMKDAPSQEDKQNVHTFLLNVVQAENIDKISKVGNLQTDKECNELGKPRWHVRGALEMARISDMLMDNKFFQEYFERQAIETLNTSLSSGGFLVRQATVQTRNVADVTKRKKYNTGMFKKGVAEESGGDPYKNN